MTAKADGVNGKYPVPISPGWILNNACEKRDNDFKEIVHMLSHDKKPEFQAVGTTSADRQPVPDTEKDSTFQRHYAYVPAAICPQSVVN